MLSRFSSALAKSAAASSSRVVLPTGAPAVFAQNFATADVLKKTPARVTVTGAAGQIGYALLFRIASGQLLGPDQPVILQLLELPHAQKALEGVVMELKDCAFPLLRGIVTTDDVNKAFEGTDFALLVGAKPRGKGMERKDLLKDNGALFAVQGKAISDNANRDTIRVVVVGNPANTNALIAAANAPKIDPRRFTALTRLDHNRGIAQLADKTGAHVTEISQFAIWGNHSATQYPDISHTLIRGQPARDLIKDEKWVRETFIPAVQQRGAAIINARGASSAASAANATIEHIHDWVHGTNGAWTSMAVYSEGEYGATRGLYYSYPVTISNGQYNIVKGLSIDEFSAAKMEATNKELLEERDAVKEYLKNA